MTHEILKDMIFVCPRKEVQLSDGCIDSLEIDAIPPTEWIQHPFAICLETCFVRKIDDHMSSIRCNIGDVVLLAVIGDEPIQNPQRDRRCTIQDIL